MDPKITKLFEDYKQGGLERREFLDRLAVLAGGPAAAAALASLLPQSLANAQVVPENDSRLVTSEAEYEAAGVKMKGYLARLKGGAKRPAVIVVHENRGLTPHIRDVARRLAVEGFLAYAVDMLSPIGGTPADESQGPKLLASITPEQHTARLAGAVPFLAKHPESTGKVGVVGFCWGGGMVNRLAVASPSLNAGVAYYGAQVPAEDVPKIRAALLLHYAGQDERINAGIPAFEAALKANNKIYEIYIYEGTQHAFNNDTGPRYHKEAAELAWRRTIEFFRKYLS